MPHLVLEYSANVPDALDADELLGRLHATLAAAGPFPLAATKSRILRHDQYRVADGAKDLAFVHLTVAVLEGRERSVLQAAGRSLLAVLEEAFPRARSERHCSFSVELREMTRELYTKSAP
jgi:5-carboxymethyl-2-hydroxymuconate isomerase